MWTLHQLVVHIRLRKISDSLGPRISIIIDLVIWVLQLEAMGFDQALVLQVFFACNKNEELAANYLLDHMHEFDE